jgi:glycosyltransferase involved in cell wall biosynthesis
MATPTVQRIKIALFIPNFLIGGAERQAYELAKGLDKGRYEVFVIALRRDGELREQFYSLPNLQIVVLEKRAALPALFRLIRAIRRKRIDLLQSFLLATNVFSLFAKLFLPRLRVLIGLRDSLTDSSFGYKSWVSRAQTRILSLCMHYLAYLGDLYVSNSEAGRTAYEEKLRVQAVVIPNGIDTNRFKPDQAARKLLCELVGSSTRAKLVGLLANCSVYKDYPTFVHAAKIIIEKVPDVHFICMGDDRTDVGAVTRNLVRQMGMDPLFHFLGTRTDVHRLLPGLDVLCSASVTEGFPSAIAEAMACGVPCVVTDVGDSRRIVGETGIVVAPRDPQALASGVLALLDMTVAEIRPLRSAARERIVQNFGVAGMVKQHENLYETLLTEAPPELVFINPST